jgi:ABC-type proline/glycine betaine transport system substrate-binding protein
MTKTLPKTLDNSTWFAFVGFEPYIIFNRIGGPNLMFGENKEKIQDLKKRLRILGDFL